jgi:RNA-directed DNA polymerase
MGILASSGIHRMGRKGKSNGERKSVYCVREVLSPLLSHRLLEQLDRKLEKRGQRFVRYADDANLYGKSERAGSRVMERVSRVLTRKLKLKVNVAKSAVARPWERKFLGFTFTAGRRPKRRSAPPALQRVKARIRQMTNRTRGLKLEGMIRAARP